MYEEIKAIFEDLNVNGASIPVSHLRYKGDEKTYVIWSMNGEQPGMAADDDITDCIASVDVDIYSEGDYRAIKKVIKKLFKENGWIWVEDSPEMYEEDTKLYHITITFEKECEVEWQE